MLFIFNMKKQQEVHEFDLSIFQIKLWVAITEDLDLLSNKFADEDTGEDIDTSFLDRHEAVTYHVQQKEKPRCFGVLIATTNKSSFTISLMAHEASHAADYVWKHIGEQDRGDEANAYLIGWIAECIESAKNN